MTQINAYLNFGGNCSEAMAFYKECFGGELTLQKVEDSPIADQMPLEVRKNVLYSTLDLGSSTIMASDMVGPKGVIRGNTVSLTLNCKSEEEIQTFFARLSSGGKITLPLQEALLDTTFGHLTDKFGIHWLLNYQKNQAA